MKEAGEGLDPEVQILLRIVTISWPSEVRNPPRSMRQQVSGRIWVRTQVSQSCPYYMQGTVLSGSHTEDVQRGTARIPMVQASHCTQGLLS